MAERETTKAWSREDPDHATIYKSKWKRGRWRVSRVAERCLQTGLSARAERPCKRGVLPESGHSLEFNGPLQMREHSLLEIRRWGLWADSAVDRDFTPLCYTITCMHLHCAEKAYSCSLEFCLGGLYNKRQLDFCPVLSLWPEWCPVCLLCVSCVLCHFTRNHQ